jgi:competence protein ComEA
MYQIYRWLYNLLGFSRSQSNAFIILLPLMVLLLLSEPVYRHYKGSPVPDGEDIRRLDSLIALFPTQESKSKVFLKSKVQEKFFRFDPNKISEDDLKKLGFEPIISRRILKYREKGGVFRTKNDLLKIHGLSPAFHGRIRSFIALPDSLAAKVFLKKEITELVISFDLNLADTTQLKLVKGIGSKISQRILKYREALGGFYQPEQLYEVYNIDSTVAERLIKVSFINPETSLRTLNINKADKKTLAIHPYISTPAAAAIVTYRLKYGDFHTVEELRKISQVDSVTFQKVKTYLTVTD